MLTIKLWIVRLLLFKEVAYLSTVYTTLIIMELKTYADVPKSLKVAVRAELIALGLEELVTE